jgi:hypothetical protein
MFLAFGMHDTILGSALAHVCGCWAGDGRHGRVQETHGRGSATILMQASGSYSSLLFVLSYIGVMKGRMCNIFAHTSLQRFQLGNTRLSDVAMKSQVVHCLVQSSVDVPSQHRSFRIQEMAKVMCVTSKSLDALSLMLCTLCLYSIVSYSRPSSL